MTDFHSPKLELASLCGEAGVIEID